MRPRPLALALSALLALPATPALAAGGGREIADPPTLAEVGPAEWFSEVFGSWRFRGCARGPLRDFFDGPMATVACARGTLTLGTRDYGGDSWVHAWMDVAVRSHSRLATPVTAELGDAQSVFGSFVGGPCPKDRIATTECGDVTLATPVRGMGAARLVWDDLLYRANGARFAPTSIQLNLVYTLDDGTMVRPSFGRRPLHAVADGPVTTVPEPGTWAMLATGLAVVGTAAGRRRR